MLLSNTLKVSYHILRSIETNVSLLVWIGAIVRFQEVIAVAEVFLTK
jgi:hypothetical protein